MHLPYPAPTHCTPPQNASMLVHPPTPRSASAQPVKTSCFHFSSPSHHQATAKILTRTSLCTFFHGAVIYDAVMYEVVMYEVVLQRLQVERSGPA